MIQLIIGEKGKGKTKVLLDRANEQIKNVNGNIVYLDKSKQHMYELNNKVRLIDVKNYPIDNRDTFLGFLCGIISQDNDLEQMYLDSFLTLTRLDEQGGDVEETLERIDRISTCYHVDFVISISITRDQVPAKFVDSIISEL